MMMADNRLADLADFGSFDEVPLKSLGWLVGKLSDVC